MVSSQLKSSICRRLCNSSLPALVANRTEEQRKSWRPNRKAEIEKLISLKAFTVIIIFTDAWRSLTTKNIFIMLKYFSAGLYCWIVLVSPLVWDCGPLFTCYDYILLCHLPSLVRAQKMPIMRPPTGQSENLLVCDSRFRVWLRQPVKRQVIASGHQSLCLFLIAWFYKPGSVGRSVQMA